ncbi:MAG TPA: class I SAM-dependent methyltransferase [Phycisphaerae bacterium]|nr:class I SAM-dependent methyltransferase [Phycisphaerae bacterium]
MTDFADYKRRQTVEFRSTESDVPRWREGQTRFVDAWLSCYLRDRRLLDAACGDGVGLRELRRLGFERCAGVDLCATKARNARAHGYPVALADLHALPWAAGTFDVVYSSHTLEHAHDPRAALLEMRRVAKPSGELVLVVPFPDPGDSRAHCGKWDLGTAADLGDDGGARLGAVLGMCGWRVMETRRDSFREPEIWVRAAAT